MELSSPRNSLDAVHDKLENFVNSIPTLPSHPMKYRDGKDDYYISYDIYVRSLIWCQYNYGQLFLQMILDDYDGYELFAMLFKNNTITIKNSKNQPEWRWNSSYSPAASLYSYLNKKLITTGSTLILYIAKDNHATLGVISKSVDENGDSCILFGMYDPHGEQAAQQMIELFQKLCFHGEDFHFINMSYYQGLQSHITEFDLGLCMLICLFWLACYMNVCDVMESNQWSTIEDYLSNVYNPLQLYHMITSFAMSKISQNADLFQQKDLHRCVTQNNNLSRSNQDKSIDRKLQQKFTLKQLAPKIPSRRRSSLFDNISQSRSSNDERDIYHDRFFLRPFKAYDKIYPVNKEIWLHVLWPVEQFVREFVMIYYRYDNVPVKPQDVKNNGLMLRLDPSYLVPCLIVPTNGLQLGDCNATCLMRKHINQIFQSIWLYTIYGDAQTRMNYIRTWASAPVNAISVSYIRRYLNTWNGLVEYLSTKETPNHVWATFRFSEDSQNDPNPESEDDYLDSEDDLPLGIPDHKYKRTGNESNDALLLEMEKHLSTGKWIWTGLSVLENGQGLILISKHRYPISQWIENELVQLFSFGKGQLKEMKTINNVVLPKSTSVDVLAQRLKSSFMYNGHVPRLEEQLATKNQLQSVLWKIIKTWKRFSKHADWIYPTFSSESFVRWCWNQDSQITV